MRDLGRIVGHIPARAGSKRVRSKNLRYLAGEPLLAYSVRAALGCPNLAEVVVNTDGDDLAGLADHLGAKVFQRDPELASDTATGDAFTYDFITKYDVDTLVMISPVCPLVESTDIEAALDTFTAQDDADTLITTCVTRMQTFLGSEAVNIDLDGPLAPTQDNREVHTLNWAVTIWDTRVYRRHYEADGHAYIGRRRILFPISPLHGVKISTEDEFQTAEALLRARRVGAVADEIRYWSAKDS